MSINPKTLPKIPDPEGDTFLRELRNKIRHLANPEEIMRCCAGTLAEYLDADRCAYANVENESTFVITGDYCRGIHSIVGRWEVAAFGEACESMMRSGQAYIVNDVKTDHRTSGSLEAYEATAIRSVICVPLHKDGRFTAAMAVHQTTPRIWSQNEVDLVRAVVAGCWESLERAWGERKLEEASDRLGLALLAAELGDWFWDPATDVVVLSKRAAEIFGIGQEPPITWTRMQELLAPEDREQTLKILGEALENNRHYDAEYRVNRPDGTQVWISAKGRAHYDPSGNPLRMYGVVQDVTRRKAMEAELRTHLAALAEADKKKDDFIALLAHELRNPLAPFRTGLEIIRQAGTQPEISQKIIEMMDRQISLMTRLIDDLLDVSRITKGKIGLQLESLDLGEVIEEVTGILEPQFVAGNLRFEYEGPGERIRMIGDKVRLTQVFGNLLSNSIKFTEPGGSILLQVIPSENEVEITLIDTGIGIDSELLPNIFEKFVQAASGTSKGGLGLGLALTRKLVEMHGGSITASSPGVGKGSRFAVRLPVGRD